MPKAKIVKKTALKKTETKLDPTINSSQIKIFMWGSIGIIVIIALVFVCFVLYMFFGFGNSVPSQTATKSVQKNNVNIKEEEKFVDINMFVTKAPERAKAVYPSVTFIDPQLGPQNAPVTIVEFSDFNCPYCAEVQPVLGEIFTKYPNQIRLVFKNLPIKQQHPSSPIAAEAALCAGDQGSFWQYHDFLFDNQDYFSSEMLVDFAKNLGLNSSSFSACLESGKMTPRVEKNMQEADDLKIDGTPYFYINKQKISGAVKIEDFIRIIESELSDKGLK